MATPLKQLRVNDPRKPSQLEVATVVGINQGFYSRLEGGDTNASPEIAQKLADFFGVEVDTIFRPALYSAELVSAEA